MRASGGEEAGDELRGVQIPPLIEAALEVAPDQSRVQRPAGFDGLGVSDGEDVRRSVRQPHTGAGRGDDGAAERCLKRAYALALAERGAKVVVNDPGGTLDGVRIVSRKTLDLMTANHLPGGGVEDMDAAVARECLAVRGGVGMQDVSTLGKIEIRGADGGLARRALTGGGLQHMPQDHLVDLVAGDTGPLQRRLDGDLAQLGRRKGRQGAQEGADRGARGGNDDDVGHGISLFGE